MIFICEFCGKKIQNKSSFVLHTKTCKENPNRSSAMSKEGKEKIAKSNTLRRKKGGWKCLHCEKIFLTRRMLTEHTRKEHSEFCLKNKRRKKIDWVCIFCNEHFLTRKMLFEHNKICPERAKEKKDAIGRIITKYKYKEEFYCSYCNRKTNSKNGNTYHEKLCKLNPNRIEFLWKGKKHSAESRIKIATSMIKNIEEKGNIKYNFNPKACEYIEKLNEEKGWCLKHALNGGEVRCGPYSIDGYDKDKNIIFEYDEVIHENSNRKEKDLIRQDFLIKNLKPNEFWRYSEKFDELYRIV